MPDPQGQLIAGCVSGSIAEELGISPGDRLLAIDNQPVRDVFDYRLRQLAAELLLTVRQADGSVVEYDLEKDEDEDLGLEFANPMLDACTRCHNRCVFCFIDQLPPGLRQTLYFKDDDLRMSFLNGNYVTLTNISEKELDRLIAYRFSPMNISVHTTDPQLRRRMMGNRKAGNILERLRKIAAAGIRLNCQLVLCPGWNDGLALEKTLRDLVALGPAVQSIAMVPVGVTRFREANQLTALEVFTRDQAAAVVDTVAAWQTRCLETFGSRLVYAGDEFYYRADRPIPPSDDYEDYPQLENGVGMAALFANTIEQITVGAIDVPVLTPVWCAVPQAAASVAEPAAVPAAGRSIKGPVITPDEASSDQPASPVRPGHVLIVTGRLAAPLVQESVGRLAAPLSFSVEPITIDNVFFGTTVTVTGLLTGQDIVTQLRPVLGQWPVEQLAGGQVQVLLPDCLLKAEEPVLLDDWTVQDLANELGAVVVVTRASAEGLAGILAWLQTLPAHLPENLRQRLPETLPATLQQNLPQTDRTPRS